MRFRLPSLRFALAALAAIGATLAPAQAEPLAKNLFGAQKLPAATAAKSYGFYSKGCFSGGVAIATDGPTWQAMRLSRNRRWGHPAMVNLIERLSREARQDGWPGLLLGDISQPRGGPMLTGHASHQIGLDADIWLTPMPDRTLSYRERENMSATLMVDERTHRVIDRLWTPAHTRLLKRAASYGEVERILVNPGIKKKLCDTVTGDRSWLRKVRPFWGHDYHFHIRIGCQPGSVGCKAQDRVAAGEGCDKSLAWWFTDEPWGKPTDKKETKPAPRKFAKLTDLPKACVAVLKNAPAASEQEVTFRGGPSSVTTAYVGETAAKKTIEAVIAADGGGLPVTSIPIPVPRPLQ